VSGECVDYNDWIIIDDSKQNFVAKPFHVSEVCVSCSSLSKKMTIYHFYHFYYKVQHRKQKKIGTQYPK